MPTHRQVRLFIEGFAVKKASAAKVASHFNDYLEDSRDQPVLVTHNGKPVAGLLVVQDKADAEHLAHGKGSFFPARIV
jgi:hypothetical protein